MADEIIRLDYSAEDIGANIDEVREARGTYDTLDDRLDNIEGGGPSPSNPIASNCVSPMTGYSKSSSSTPGNISTSDTLNAAIGKLEKRTELNENNISLIKHADNTSIYIQETTPTGAVGDYWISAANGVKTYGRTAQLFNIDDRNMFFNGYINLTPDVINTSTGGSMSAIIPCTAGEQYTIAVNSKTLRIAGVATPPANNTPAISPYRQSYDDYNKHTYTYTAPTGSIYLLVTCYLLSVEVADEKSIDDVFGTLMINEGTTAEEFAPYYDWT